MPTQTWTVLDTENNEHRLNDSFDIGQSGITVTSHTYRGGLADGVSSLRVDNGAFSFEILLTRGLSIWQAAYKDTPLGWQAPVQGPVHPSFVNISEPSGLGWLDGFDEFLVRCGLESNGAPEFDDQGRLQYPLHGRIGNKPAHHVELAYNADQQELTITGLVDETRFHFSKLRLKSTIKTKAGEAGFRIHDEIENLSASPAEMQMLYHVNFGPPLLAEGSQVVAPVEALVPRNAHAASSVKNWDTYQAPQPGFEEQVYFAKLVANAESQTHVLLKNKEGSFGVSTLYNIEQLPCLTIWKNTTALTDGYVTGIEPGTNFPNPRSYEAKQGRVVKLAAHATTAFDYQLHVRGSQAEIAAAEKEITTLQQAAAPNIASQPQPGWCIDA